MRLAPLLLLALVGCRPMDPGAESQAAEMVAAPVGEVHRAIRVIDGDTFAVGDETIRLENIDAPELPPRAGCWAEARLAWEAKAALSAAVEMARSAYDGRVVISRSGRDQYGRTLARVSFDGGDNDAGLVLVRDGVAVPWTGRRWDWCGPVSADTAGAGLIRDPLVGATDTRWREVVAPRFPGEKVESDTPH